MTTVYKLTDEHDRTYGDPDNPRPCQWGQGAEHTADGNGPLCSKAWLHAYTDPLLAILLNPIHANIDAPHLWEADGDIGAVDHGLKVGCTRLRTLRQIPLPEVTLEQRVHFGILSALAVYDEANFVDWAKKWLSGKERSADAAYAAAADAARAAARAAADVARAARAAARAAADVARAAADAAADAAAKANPLDLIALAYEAVNGTISPNDKGVSDDDH